MADRIAQIRGILESEGWDAILISDQDNRYFASGYRADDHSGRSAGVLLVTLDLAQLYTNGNNIDWAQDSAPGFEAVKTVGLWESQVGEAIKASGAKRVGFEAATLPHSSFVRLAQSLEGVELVSIGDQIDRLRWVKTPQEAQLSSSRNRDHRYRLRTNAPASAARHNRARSRKPHRHCISRPGSGRVGISADGGVRPQFSQTSSRTR